MPTPYTLTQLKEIVEPVARRHGVKKVSIFVLMGADRQRKRAMSIYISKKAR